MSIASSPTAPPRMARISDEDAFALYTDCSIHELGRRAHAVTLRLHPEPYRTYVVDRNINYANWCTARCAFCNFKADPPDGPSGRRDLPTGYTHDFRQIGEKIEQLIAIGGTQILMQGGLVPADGPAGLPFAWYLDLLRFIKKNYPQLKVIMLTAFADLKNAIESKKLGAEDFISKPYDLVDLLTTIERVLSE